MVDRVAIMAPGPSLTYKTASQVDHNFRNKIAVSNAFSRCRDPMAIVSTDAAWWDRYLPDTMDCDRYMGKQLRDVPGVTKFGHRSDINSGALAILIASQLYDARSIYLFGFDMHDKNGAHFFGDHTDGLRNTPAHRWGHFQVQFQDVRVKCDLLGVRVYNCTPGSALACFDKLDPKRVLCRS